MSIIDQPQSPVDITPSIDSVEVTVHHTVGGPQELATATAGILGPIYGMVTLKTYGKNLLLDFDLDRGDGERAVKETLPHAVDQVVKLIRFSQYRQFNRNKPMDAWPFTRAQPGCSSIDQDLLSLRLSPFRSNRSILQIMRIMFFGEDDVELATLEDSLLISDLPATKLYLEKLEESCTCHKCQPGSTEKSYKKCSKDIFFQYISMIVADICALSLFLYPDPLLVKIADRHQASRSNSFKDAIQNILETGRSSDCAIIGLIQWAIGLVGHDDAVVDLSDSNWVMSSSHGQAVWPNIFNNNIINAQGYLTLSWAFGNIGYKGTMYSRVQGLHGFNPIQDVDYKQEVTSPAMLFSGLELIWRVEKGDGVLKATLGLDGMDGRYSYAHVSPTTVIKNLASALIMEVCEHESLAPLRQVDQFCAFTSPAHPTKPAAESRNKNVCTVGIAAVDGADDLRLFALACEGMELPVVLRKAACLSCCLKICRRANYPVLIL